ncbi:Optic atrophy 3-like protein [Corchorus capsularis]|uniref:Optic atrophy 3-like protein n=1 Tax=Corchorus capsularis TaxID=210143 RepID=A0A1R3HXI2_COCAP|nr:Optic atrophy 3-like protein [Corchorus capsularis]
MSRTLIEANHRLSINLQRKIYGQSTQILIRPLNEERAIAAAAGLLGELVIFTVAGAAIIYEVQRSAKSEAKKEEQRRKELEVTCPNS